MTGMNHQREISVAPIHRTIALVVSGLVFWLLVPVLAAAQSEPSEWRITGDLRTMYSASWRDARDGSERDSDTLGARFRLRLARDLNSSWRVQTRFATTFEDQGNDPEFFIRSNRESPTSIEPGSATLDEAFLQYRSPDRATEVRVGRMQSSFKLPLITGKSLDRNQASNINIGWTDGILLRRDLIGGWQTSLTGQYNSADGNGTVLRGPLDFSDSGSRISTWATLENNEELGPVFLRALTLTWYPDALAADGIADPGREDYVAATLKAAAGWALGDVFGGAATRLVVAGSVGQAFNRPSKQTMRLPGEGQSDGFSWQLGADLVEIFPDHTIGVVTAQADAGWLISNDFRQNDSLAEFRWQWQVSKPLLLEFRARWRREIDLLAGVADKQRDRDMRLRATLKF